MVDMSHLNALHVRLSHERARLPATRSQRERKLRLVWIGQIQREIAAELAFLGLPADSVDGPEMTDDGLLAELGIVP